MLRTSEARLAAAIIVALRTATESPEADRTAEAVERLARAVQRPPRRSARAVSGR